MSINELAGEVKEAAIKLAGAGTELKNKALAQIAVAIKQNKDEILKANSEDLKRSEKENLSLPLLKRLKFDEAKIEDVVDLFVYNIYEFIFQQCL